MLFSILIPVYNAETYLEKCIESAINQTFQGEYEIILLDDGSIDRSRIIAESYQKKYFGKVYVYHQANSGEYLSRRKLVEYAKGEYLLFLDSDDTLTPDALESLSIHINEKDADLILFDLIKRGKENDEIFSLPLNCGTLYEGERKYEIYRLLLLTKYLNSMCTKAVRKRCFDLDEESSNIRGPINGADLYQSYPIIDRARSVYYLNRTLYIYRKNDKSITMTLNYKVRFISMQLNMQRSDYYMDKWKIMETDRNRVYAKRLTNICNCALSCLQSKDPEKEKKEFLYEVRTNSYFQYLAEIQPELYLNDYIRFVTKQLKAGRTWVISLSLYFRKMLRK